MERPGTELSLRLSTLLDIVTEVQLATNLASLGSVVAHQTKWLVDFEEGEFAWESGRVALMADADEVTLATTTEEPPLDSSSGLCDGVLQSGIASRDAWGRGEELVLPLRADRALVGALGVRCRSRHFSPLDVTTLRLFSIQLAAAVDAAMQRSHLRTANRELEEARASRDRLTAMVVHDLRSPIQGALSALVLVRLKAHTDERDTWLDSIEQSLRSMTGLVDDLLLVRRLAAGKMTLERHSFDLDHMVAEALGRAAPNARAAEKTLLEPKSATERIEVFGDRRILGRVLDNLLGNAVKHTGTGGTIEVRTRLEEDASDSAVVIEVRDDGPGVDPAVRDTLFEEFVHSSDATRDGFGLGLAFCRLAIEAHDGELACVDDPEPGSVFQIRLPVRTSDEPPRDRGSSSG